MAPVNVVYIKYNSLFRVTFICVEIRETVEQVTRFASCPQRGEGPHSTAHGAPSIAFAVPLTRGVRAGMAQSV
jgi:hypothetical protein